MEPLGKDSPDHPPAGALAWPPKPTLPNDLPDIRIYPSPRQWLIMLVFGSIFVVLGAINIVFGVLLTHYLTNNEGIVFFEFSLGCAAIILALSFRRLPLIEITRTGFIDRSSITAAGLVRWDEISGAEIRSRLSKVLVVTVLDPEDVIRRQRSYKQKLMRRSQSNMGSPVVIGANLVPIPLDELQGHILQRMGTPASTEQSL